MTELAVTAPSPADTAAARPAAASAAEREEVAEAGTLTDEIVVLDYGGQYSQLIARRVRDCGVFSELIGHSAPLEEIARRKPRGIILSGGPASVYTPGAPRLQRELLSLGIPVLGICYGMQLLVHELGGRVEEAEVGEFGRSDLRVLDDGGVLLGGTPSEQTCWMSHRDSVFEPPPGFTTLASSSASPVAAIESTERRIYGIQFHPEVVHTPYGRDILLRFLTDVCGCSRTWSAASIVDEQIARVRAAGRRWTGDLRALRGRRLLGGRAPRAPRRRRAADLRLRRPRADAKGRGRAGDRRLPRHLQRAARRR